MKKITQEKFIERAKQVHGDKYDYSKVNYVNMHTKVTIICPIHGEFLQTPDRHLNSDGCKKCAIEKVRKKEMYSTQEFIEKARKIHGDKYDYSKVEYNGMHKDVCIICPIHGEFWQTPNGHIKNKSGCPKCKGKNLTTEEWIELAKQVHGDKYDYSKVNYNGSYNKVKIICPIHGEFLQTPHDHLEGRGCSKCNQSHLEREIENLLTENEIKFEYNKFYKKLEGLQLDFYIPSKNIAIECQGIQHFKVCNRHKDNNANECEYKNIVERDDRKRRLCQENNIKLLYFSNLKISYPYKVYEDKNELINIIHGKESKN